MNQKQSFSRGVRGSVGIGLALVGLAGLSGCGRKSESGTGSGSGEKPVVFASVAPIAGLVERIGGDRIVVETLAGPGNDPHGFSPTPKQLIDLGNSKAFFVVGMPFEETLVAKLASGTENLPIVDVSKEIEKLETDHHHHDHDHEHEHDHGEAETEADAEAAHDEEHEHDHDAHHDCGESDPHVWLSPELLKKQAAVIEETLHDLDPEGHEVFHANYEALIADLEALDAELSEELAPMKGQAFYVYHGAFAYFAQAYGLTQEAIEIAGRSPEPKRVFELIEQAKADDVRLIIVQPQFDTRSAETIAEGIGGAVLPIDPVEKDVFATLRTLSEKIQESRSAPE